MPDKPWKRFEREVARLLGSRRFWANSGERLDVEGPTFLAQAKLVGRLSLAELSDLATEVERAASVKAKLGLVAVKLSGHRGNRPMPTLIVMTAATFAQLPGIPDAASGEDTT